MGRKNAASASTKSAVVVEEDEHGAYKRTVNADELAAAAPLNFSVYEAGPGFLRYHLSAPRLVLALIGVVALLAATLHSTSPAGRWAAAVRAHAHPWCLAFIGVFMFAFPVFGPTFRRFVPFEARYPITRVCQFLWGVLVTINFMLFWAIPIYAQGASWKQLGFARLWRIPYSWLDNNETLRAFASKYVYGQKRFADFFAAFFCTICNVASMLALAFYFQLSWGYLPWWFIVYYNFAWVGPGGRGMGCLYTFAHKEGHFRDMLSKPLRETLGNICENWLGPVYGNVPFIFTTSHMRIHHGLNGCRGDSIYMWDLDRSSFADFQLYIYRMTLHSSALSSLWYFQRIGDKKRYDLLMRGCIIYYVITPVILYAITGSFTFLFWIWVQPFFCMVYFLCFLNYAQHGFLEYGADGKKIECVDSLTIIDGQDDSFGEDDHIAHHYATTVYYKDLPEWQRSQREVWKKHYATVFREVAIIEVTAFQLLKRWDLLADKFVDYNEEGSPNRLAREPLMKRLQQRVQFTECSHKEYEKWLENFYEPMPTTTTTKA